MVFVIDQDELCKVMQSLGVRNYVELSALFMLKTGHYLNPRRMADQIYKYGHLSETMSGNVAALRRICELEGKKNVLAPTAH